MYYYIYYFSPNLTPNSPLPLEGSGVASYKPTFVLQLAL